ncbi:MAG: ATP-dependent protease ATPase subunit HslU [Planctomycetota bacterium]|nr:ATP-dependent protease ATPase subunit HslU [Planctomycetota bacterium]
MIGMTGSTPEMKALTPRKIVEELDRHIVGQKAAKRAVAIALRNRWRRQQLPPEIRADVTPKNIIMIGPTGVGKTEIGRRLAQLVRAPFLKVEASKFTEVGYVGRDVESIIRDLADVSFNLVREERMRDVEPRARDLAEARILDLLLPNEPEGAGEEAGEQRQRSRERMKEWLREGKMEDKEVEVDVLGRTPPMLDIFSSSGIEQMGVDFQNMFEKLMPQKSQRRRLTVKEARRVLTSDEAEKLIDREKLQRDAIQRAEESGIVFLDEIDKVVGGSSSHGPDVSREGVQRDLLPIVEGSTVATRFGMVRTDPILFIAAGAFHSAKPSDLIPELQGRFPIRVELQSLSQEDFVRVLSEPEGALTKQYAALLKAEGTQLEFGRDALEEISRIAAEVNRSQQNIGARRLHTVLERLLEDLLFDPPAGSVAIDAAYVRDKLKGVSQDEDLQKYVL